MGKLLEAWRKLTRLRGRRRLEQDLAEEMRQHLEWRAQEYIAEGMPERDAHRAARLAFGNPVALAERSRETWSFLRFETWLQDVAYGARLLWRDRGWAAMTAATLALGIGGTVATFTFVNAFLLRPLPFEDPDRLVHVWAANTRLRTTQGRISVPDFLDLRKEATLFSGLAAFNYTEEDLTGGSEPERIFAGRVSGNAFQVLGVEPALGRGFTPGADAPGAPREVVLSDAFWRARFNGAPSAIGRVLHVNGHPYTVVGVMPANVVFPLPITQLWVPRVLDPSADGRARRYLQVFGRMRPGVTRAQAGAELQAIAARLVERHPEENANVTVRVVPLRDALNFASDILAPMSAALGASVFFVFLIVCANVASLMVARGVARTHEMAVRAALGGGRWRLVRQLLTESALLALCGGALGALLASWNLSRISDAVPPDLYRVGPLALDRDGLVFALGVSLLSVALFGVLPAIRGTRPDPSRMLKEGGRTSGSPRHRRTQRLLVIGQLATSTLLLVAAALMIGSVRELRRVPLGFQPDGVLTAKLVLPANRYADADEVRLFHRRLLEQASSLPGLDRAATVDYLPLNHEFPLVEAFPVGAAAGASEGAQATELSVSSGYFSAMDIPLLRGRSFSDADGADTPHVAVLNQPLATALFPGADAVNRTVVLRSRAGAERTYTVVGVAGASRFRTLKGSPDRHVYLSQLQHPTRYLRVIVRAAPGMFARGAELRDVVRAVDPLLPVTEVRTMATVVEEFLAPEVNISSALTEHSITALLLALVGLYGVTAFSIALRRREIGVRMALGASPGQILRLIVGQGLRMGAAGILLGLAAAFALTRFLSDFLFGVPAADPVIFGGVAALLLGCSAAACHLPARRAARIDPAHTLRSEG
jgi:putative ABC transport system permease protein